MNDETTNLDRVDEDILNTTISDEAIEAAAGSEIQPTYVLPCRGEHTAGHILEIANFGFVCDRAACASVFAHAICGRKVCLIVKRC
jgi:hypothetical protein